MFQELPVREKNIFAFRVSGKLTDEDYQRFLPKLDELIAEHGKISLLLELEDFHGWELGAAWDDFRYGMAHQEDFERIAIVSDKRWHRWVVKLAGLMSQSEIRFFDRDDLQAAWDWLRGGDEPAKSRADATTTPAVGKVEAYRRILVAIDFTEHSDVALKRALELARHYDAELALVHAVEPMIYAFGDTDGVVVPYDFVEQETLLFDAAVKKLDELADSLDYAKLSHEVVWGTPKGAVLAYAEAQRVDLIAAGSHGRHGLARLLGSTSRGLVNGARCDVLVVRIPG